ncbi:MAG: hypothetical protein IJ371_00635 [Clostridia bacterium]|nr:hypothetical protein [Clostridia bacterium]
MEKDKIVLVGNNEYVIIKGNNCKSIVGVDIIDDILTFSVYKSISAEHLGFTKAFSVKNKKRVRIVEFEDEIYLRAKHDKESIAPICIEECGDTLNVIDLLDTDCDNIVEDMQGDINQVSQNFEIVEGRPFLMEDEFSV